MANESIRPNFDQFHTADSSLNVWLTESATRENDRSDKRFTAEMRFKCLQTAIDNVFRNLTSTSDVIEEAQKLYNWVMGIEEKPENTDPLP